MQRGTGRAEAGGGYGEGMEVRGRRWGWGDWGEKWEEISHLRNVSAGRVRARW